jgi:Uncharacterised nucleotidyltransferase
VRQTLAEEIVGFLGFSSLRSIPPDCFTGFSQRQWRYALRWLDDSGLALYFLNKLKANATNEVPEWVMARLEQNFAANQQRVDDMAHRFGGLNQKFHEVGVRYVVLKGFSLVPHFCPDATLRHQGDFDYLVDDYSLPAARGVLTSAGYNQKPGVSRQDSVFVIPGTRPPSRSSDQYFAHAPHAVELHLDIWDSEQHELPLMPRLFSVERATTQHWRGFAFPALADEDAFLLQVLHACQHLFTYWIRMCCLFEIGYFLQLRASDTPLWNRIEQRVGDNSTLRDFVVITGELAAKLFAVHLPPLIRIWGTSIPSASRIWIENYARRWAFSEVPNHRFCLFPQSKLALFLHQQYRDACALTPVVRKRVLPLSRFSRIVESLGNQPSLVLDSSWWKQQALLRRSLFHGLASLRYVCEIPRWRWLNRLQTRPGAIGPVA